MTDHRTSDDDDHSVSFGPFRLLTRRRLLFRGDDQLPLGSRAVEILVLLIEHAGEVVSKAHIIDRVWPGTFVEESNLRVQIAAIRRALSDVSEKPLYLQTVAGRGYRFVGTLTASSLSKAALPHGHSGLLGREAEITDLCNDIADWRLVTLVGLGGVGKTRMALEVLKNIAPQFRDGSYSVDLLSISDPLLVPGALAAALGAAVKLDDPLPTLVTRLRDQQVLLFFDNCEHVVGAIATLAEQILDKIPQARILVTSREPLRAEGERVRRLSPLGLPPKTVATAAEALQSPAVQLFMQRAAGRSPEFTELSDADAPLVADICRRLDGLALAIELAAGQVESIRLAELDSLLDERFLQLGGGNRSADDRHKTLAATLDWSYGLLSPNEQTILRRLGVFTGSFDLPAGAAVAGHSGLDPDCIFAGILGLAAKSLLVVEKATDGARTRYRLLETTRAYALRQLRVTENEAVTRQRHAEHCLQLCTEAEADWDLLPRPEWMALSGRIMGDVRTAIDWCMANGSITQGLELILASAPVGVQLSLVDEYRLRIDAGLQRIVAKRLGSLLELQFTTALGHLMQQLRGPLPSVLQAFSRCLELASELNNPQLTVDTYRGMWVAAFGSGNYPLAHDYATRQVHFAEQSADPYALLQAKRMLAQAEYYKGEFDMAVTPALQVMNDPLRHIPLRWNFPLQVDRKVSLGIILARTAWIRGEHAEARRLVEQCLGWALADHAIALCHALALAACPVAFWSGDYERVRERSEQLIEHAGRNGSLYWQSWGEMYRDALVYRLGGRSQPASWASLEKYPKKVDMLATLDTAFATDMAQQRVEEGMVGWCAPEVLRARAETQIRAGTPEAAIGMLEKAAFLARRQDARSWMDRIEGTMALL